MINVVTIIALIAIQNLDIQIRGIIYGVCINSKNTEARTDMCKL